MKNEIFNNKDFSLYFQKYAKKDWKLKKLVIFELYWFNYYIELYWIIWIDLIRITVFISFGKKLTKIQFKWIVLILFETSQAL